MSAALAAALVVVAPRWRCFYPETGLLSDGVTAVLRNACEHWIAVGRCCSAGLRNACVCVGWKGLMRAEASLIVDAEALLAA